MNRLNLFFLSGVLCAAVFSSCTIQKRTFNSGYFVQWNKKHSTLKHPEQQQNNELHPDQAAMDESLSFKNSDKYCEAQVAEVSASKEEFSQTLYADFRAQQVTEITNEITALHPKASSPSTANFASSSKEKNTSSFVYKESKKGDKKSGNAAQNGGKLQIVALILCILLGLIGVHRFYLGYTGLGILYLLTLGIFGIGWIIDIILLIIPNGLTPKGKTNYKA